MTGKKVFSKQLKKKEQGVNGKQLVDYTEFEVLTQKRELISERQVYRYIGYYNYTKQAHSL